MSPTDPLDDLLRDLAARTQDLSTPANFDARIEAAIASSRPSSWEVAWTACRAGLPFAMGVAALAVAVAVAEERQASRSVPSPDQALAAEVEPP